MADRNPQLAEIAQRTCGPCSRGQHACCDGNEYVRCDCHGPAPKVESEHVDAGSIQASPEFYASLQGIPAERIAADLEVIKVGPFPPAFSCRHCDYTSDEYGDTHTHPELRTPPAGADR